MVAADAITWQVSARQITLVPGTAGTQIDHSIASSSSSTIAYLPKRIAPTAKANGNGHKGRADLSGQSGRRNNSIYYRIGSYGWGMGITGLYWFGNMGYASATAPRPRFVVPGFRRRKGRKRIMLLMSDTGGGHRASAQAIMAGFNKLYGDKFELDMVDLWSDHSPWPHNTMPQSYSFLVKYPWLWRLSYTLTQPRFVHKPISVVTGWQVGHRVAMAYDQYDPDLVVSVHPLMQDVPLRVLRARMRNPDQRHVNFATVVTDLTTCHNTWFHPGVTKCFVPTQEAKSIALRMGLSEDQIVLHGLPIRPEFSARGGSKKSIRTKLGLLHNKPTVLLIGGGEGMGPVEKTVNALADARVSCQVVVVCGRNAALATRLSTREYPPELHVVVKGFVTNMPDWMRAADAVITKAGPGTISEALICGLPILLNANVPCQEEGNIPYVVDNHVGAHETNPVRAAATIKSWFDPDNAHELRAMSKRAKALGKPEALFEICRDLAKLME